MTYVFTEVHFVLVLVSFLQVKNMARMEKLSSTLLGSEFEVPVN